MARKNPAAHFTTLDVALTPNTRSAIAKLVEQWMILKREEETLA